MTPRRKPPADEFVSAFPPTYFDAILVVSFGGPEGLDDVMPFLENVTRGRDIPRERLEEVAHHYARFDGVSPLNAQNRALIAALRAELDASGIDLPIYLGNRNWHPLLTDVLRRMTADGVQRALAFFTSAYSSYSSCRQYRENIYEAQQAAGPRAPEVLKTRMFYNHPGFIQASANVVGDGLALIPAARRAAAHVCFTAHSIPMAMARQCRYASQLGEAARLVAETLGIASYSVVYQSRSGAPHVPWLEPDVCDRLRQLKDQGFADVVVAPIGFLSDHMEVIFDLDVEARSVADELGLNLVRAATVGTHPLFMAAIRELIEERLTPGSARRSVGRHGPCPDDCAPNCCRPGTRRPSPWEAVSG